MTFDGIAQAAAKRADEAVRVAMSSYRDGLVEHEDDLTGVLVGALAARLSGEIGGLTWSTAILKHTDVARRPRNGALALTSSFMSA